MVAMISAVATMNAAAVMLHHRCIERDICKLFRQHVGLLPMSRHFVLLLRCLQDAHESPLVHVTKSLETSSSGESRTGCCRQTSEQPDESCVIWLVSIIQYNTVVSIIQYNTVVSIIQYNTVVSIIQYNTVVSIILKSMIVGRDDGT
jgi:hypothetical protein